MISEWITNYSHYCVIFLQSCYFPLFLLKISNPVFTQTIRCCVKLISCMATPDPVTNIVHQWDRVIFSLQSSTWISYTTILGNTSASYSDATPVDSIPCSTDQHSNTRSSRIKYFAQISSSNSNFIHCRSHYKTTWFHQRIQETVFSKPKLSRVDS